MDDRDLLILKYLAEFKNITKTANALFISQPALTKRIQQLEKELGTHLIRSTNKGIALTPTGMETAAYADEALRHYDELKTRITAIDNKNAGIIKLTAPNIICEYYFPTLIKEFKKIYPEVKFSITMAPSSKVVSLMNNNKCHFGFLRNDFGWDESQRIHLATNFIAAASTQPFQLADLANMSRVAYTTDAYYMKMLDLWWDNNFKTPPHTEVLVNSLDLCREMVFSGIGFGLLPSVLLTDAPFLHQMILKDKNGSPIQRHTWLIFKKKNINTPLLKNFLEFIKEREFKEFLQPKEIPFNG
ncbi:LysR family transcriptional regulator [Acidaminococcus fermentans]|uniref:LysR family transcriptional regulator n=1 Tax=Acidaminococcus fermentans TaxID=905 RepID=UPI002430B44B|nr:LysR family transcriptional regulator [Acidaminococcus fermentans]MCI6285313.1 LysR family transcriptional regulator [Acidaminococcus fermentans]